MATYTGFMFDYEWEFYGLKEIFGNRKNLARYWAAFEWNNTHAWLISLGCRENL